MTLTLEQRARYAAHRAALSPAQRARADAFAAAYNKLMRMGRKLLDKHGLKRWAFCIAIDDEPGFFEVGSGLHGQCSHTDKSITLHHDFVWRPRDAKQTIIHEIAHALVRRRYGKRRDDDHGPKWCKIARQLGCRTWSTIGQYERALLIKKFPELASAQKHFDGTVREYLEEQERRERETQ